MVKENTHTGTNPNTPKGTDETKMLIRFNPPEYPSGRLVPDYVKTMLDKVQPDSMFTEKDRDDICVALKQWLVDVGLVKYHKKNFRWEWTTPDWHKYLPPELLSALKVRFASHANIPLLEDHANLPPESHMKRKVFHVQELIVDAILKDACNDELIEKSWGRTSEDLQLVMVWGGVAVANGTVTTIANLAPASISLATMIGSAAAGIAGILSVKTFITSRNGHIGYKLTNLGGTIVEQFAQYAPVKAAGSLAQYEVGYSQSSPAHASTRNRQGMSRLFTRK